MNNLFVYGIFLSERNRERYDMQDPRYATVNGWKTVAITDGYIVEAVQDTGTLTGLLVSISDDQLRAVDQLEYGYDRVMVKTTNGEYAFMYARKGQKGTFK